MPRQLLGWLALLAFSYSASAALPKLQSIWERHRSLNDTDLAELRQGAWDMFDQGFTNYMSLAFPKDNLLPISCKGEDWQGGMAVTLLDALDSLMMMGRLSDMRSALPLIADHVNFQKPIKVHVFEVVIRVVGGLLSGHTLLTRVPDVIPEYDGRLLRLATELAEAMLPAFDTPSGLPWMFTNLKTGPVTDIRHTCTACVGTLLLEYGTLSELQGDPRWRQLAEHAVTALYSRRSSLGLVGSSLDVGTSSWVSREATIGPGSDSFYEYMIKSYLMFGNKTHLDMFCELYTAAMRHLQIPGTLNGYSFLADVHMDSGRMARPYVSSLGAFWPGMQALVGQVQDAVDLHSNFTAAWQTFGWLPELFGLDLERVHPEDPGYNLRPEHIESTYILHAATGRPIYRQIAARMQQTLESANKAKCGYASVSNVETGAQHDLQESFFLSETVKYFYLTFTPYAAHLLDYYVLSTEGHLLPTFQHTDVFTHYQEEADYNQAVAREVPENCRKLCAPIDDQKQSEIEAGLRTSFPLLTFKRADAQVIKRRRCIACVAVTRHMEAHPPPSISARLRIMQLSAELQAQGSSFSPNKALAQVVCVIRVSKNNGVVCNVVRPLTTHDLQHGLPHNAVVLQLTWVETAQPALLIVSPVTPQDKSSLYLQGGPAAFGPSLVEITPTCRRQLYNTTWPWLKVQAERRAGAAHCGLNKLQRAWWNHTLSYEPRSPVLSLPQLSLSVRTLAEDVLLLQEAMSLCMAAQDGGDTTAQHRPTPPRASDSMPEGTHSTGSGQPGQDGPEIEIESESGEQVSQTKAARAKVVTTTTSQVQVPAAPATPASGHTPPACSKPDSDSLYEPEPGGRPTAQDISAEATDAVLPQSEECLVAGQCPAATDSEGYDPPTQAQTDSQTQTESQSEVTADRQQHSYTEAVSGADAGEACDPDQEQCSARYLYSTLQSDMEHSQSGTEHSQPGTEHSQPGTEHSQSDMEHSQSDMEHSQSDPLPARRPRQQRQRSHGSSHHTGSDSSDSDPECVIPDYLVFGSQLPQSTRACRHVPVTYGELVLTSPLTACDPRLINVESVSGHIAVVVRGGGCSFMVKAMTVQAAGAVGMVVLDLSGRKEEIVTMLGDGGTSSNSVHIPSLLLDGRHSRLLLEAMHDAAARGVPRPVGTLALEAAPPSASLELDPAVQRAARGTTTVYMLVPGNSQPFVKANLLDRGIDLQTALDSMLQDDRVSLLLMQVAKENEAVHAEQRRQKEKTKKTAS